MFYFFTGFIGFAAGLLFASFIAFPVTGAQIIEAKTQCAANENLDRIKVRSRYITAHCMNGAIFTIKDKL